MKQRLRGLAADAGILEIAIGVALALAVVNLAGAIGTTVTAFWRSQATAESAGGLFDAFFGVLAVRLGDRYLDFSYLLAAAIEVLVVLVIALWAWPRAATPEADR